ncbi:MAG: TPR repeat domain protein [Oceanicaulis sp. HLUCCA04]|nr:MAG: TPR repeat domain protein [Oceanicaulis sp. HLUCCA04]
MTFKTLLVSSMAALALTGTAAHAQAIPEGESYQTESLFGERLYTRSSATMNLADPSAFERATQEAYEAYQAEITPDTATWYGRLLSYQGYFREAVEVYDAAIELFPENAKLRRHRAHRYFTLRDFDASIGEGLRSAELYENMPLERERLGPDYFPSTPDVVQFYLYYHLGQAYFANNQYAEAAHWFNRSHAVALGVNDAVSITAAVYWEYLSLARAGDFFAARELLDGYTYSLEDLSDNIESNFYFDGIQLFKGEREFETFFSDEDTGMAFSDASAAASSTAFTLANYLLLQGHRDEAREWYRRSIDVDGWSYFARIQAEADWATLYPGETP